MCSCEVLLSLTQQLFIEKNQHSFGEMPHLLPQLYIRAEYLLTIEIQLLLSFEEKQQHRTIQQQMIFFKNAIIGK